jgi:chromate reductase, NAD(P)H dehydrogenase (quinone)
MRILAISGSLRSASYNTALLRAAADLAPEDVSVELYEGIDRLPPFNEDDEGGAIDPGIDALREAIASADAVLFSTPEYNGTMPGHVKQAVDWASRPHGPDSALWGKPVAAIGASVTDYGALWAQDHLRRALGLAGARVLDVELPVSKAQERFDADGVLIDLELRDRLAEIVGTLAERAHGLAVAA